MIHAGLRSSSTTGLPAASLGALAQSCVNALAHVVLEVFDLLRCHSSLFPLVSTQTFVSGRASFKASIRSRAIQSSTLL